jgi:chlorophyll synthase
MLRFKYMPVVLGPLYLGFVLAGKKLLPAFTPDSLGRFAAAVIALGPLLWTGTLLFNDSIDLAGDRCNPRRSRTPLVRGEIGERQVMVWAVGLKAGGLLLAMMVSPGFFLVLFICAVLSWMYSAKPFRLKGRPGFDVLVNAVGVGALCTLSGWTVLRPLGSFPWLFLLPLVLGWASLYIPTSMVDEQADRRAGMTTCAVRLGNHTAFRLSLTAMILSVFLIYGMALCRYVLTPSIIAWTAPVAVLQVFVFWRHARHWDRPDKVYQGLMQAALLGIFLEILVVLNLAGVIGGAA